MLNLARAVSLATLVLFLPVACGDSPDRAAAQARLPAGLELVVFADDVYGARQLAVAADGTVAVGSRGEAVYLLRDQNGDGQAEWRHTIDGLNKPHGVAWHGGTLYIGEIDQVLAIADVATKLAAGEDLLRVPVLSGFPTSSHHGLRNLAVDRTGRLVVGFGVPCNICPPSEDVHKGTLRRYDLRSGISETIARGVRNSVGFDWHQRTGELWFTDNGRDWLGDDKPSDELNRLSAEGLHFGFPYCHQGDLPDPEFGEQGICSEFEPPVYKTGAHVANLGLHFYRGQQLPFADRAFIALHGSWNRAEKVGYEVRIMSFSTDGTAVTKYEPFIRGWLDNGQVLARPVDIDQLPNGSLLISDDYNNAVYLVR